MQAQCIVFTLPSHDTLRFNMKARVALGESSRHYSQQTQPVFKRIAMLRRAPGIGFES